MLLLGCLSLALACGEDTPTAPNPGLAGGTAPDPARLRVQREELDATLWRTETLAQEHEQRLVSLWDDLLAAGRRDDALAKFRILADLDPGQVVVGALGPATPLDHGIALRRFEAPTRALGPDAWRGLLEQLAGSLPWCCMAFMRPAAGAWWWTGTWTWSGFAKRARTGFPGPSGSTRPGCGCLSERPPPPSKRPACIQKRPETKPPGDRACTP